MNKRIIIHLLLLIVSSIAQSYQQQLFEVLNSGGPGATGTGIFQFDSTYTPSGSIWELDWSEEIVSNRIMSYTDPNSENRSFELRIGKGGQIFSFRSPGFGEALPPQFRPSYDESGSNISDPGMSDPVKSHHGNWAVWNDEVWQLVGSDQRDSLNGSAVTQNIHQAGPYMNNYAHRKSDLTDAPFYSPQVQSFFNESEQSFSSIYWGQSENPIYVYEAPYECDNCFPDLFRPSVLFFQKHTNIGEGVIQVDFLIYNFHRTRGIDYWNVPFMGIRHSSLPYLIISNSPTDASLYEAINSKAGHPDGSGGFLPEFKEGVTLTTSGNKAASSGWFAFSTDPNGDGPTLAFVTAKESNNPVNGYGDFRYGTAMANALRDVTIFSRRAFGGAVDPATGFKQWGIVAGESIGGRYFILLDDNIDSIVSKIESRGLISSALLEKETIPEEKSNEIYFQFSKNEDSSYSALQTTEITSELSVNSAPFTGSYPVFLICTDSQSVVSSDPYHFSLKPYDGTAKKIELLGFSSIAQYKVLTNSTSAIENNSLSKNSFIKVNLFSDKILISNIKKVPNKIELTNIKGQNITIDVQFNSVSGSAIINVNDLAPGVYFLRVNNTINHFTLIL